MPWLFDLERETKGTRKKLILAWRQITSSWPEHHSEVHDPTEHLVGPTRLLCKRARHCIEFLCDHTSDSCFVPLTSFYAEWNYLYVFKFNLSCWAVMRLARVSSIRCLCEPDWSVISERRLCLVIASQFPVLWAVRDNNKELVTRHTTKDDDTKDFIILCIGEWKLLEKLTNPSMSDLYVSVLKSMAAAKLYIRTETITQSEQPRETGISQRVSSSF